MWRLFITLYLLIAVCVVGFNVLSYQFLSTFYEDEIIEDRIQDIRGWLLTIEYFSEHVSNSDFESLIDSISRESNFPIEILTNAEVAQQFPQSISQFDDNNLFFINVDDYELLYTPESKPGILKIGPLQSTSVINAVEDFLDYAFLFLLAVVILLWQLNLWRKLNGLEKKVVEFGEGDLAARASENPGIRIGKLNRTFNGMADKTGQLIQQNRQLIRAVSHELRSPISRLRCLVDLVDSNNSTSFQNAAYLDDMSEDIAELESLVDEILSYTRLEAPNSIDSSVKECDLKPILLELLSTINREFSKKIPLTCEAGVCARIDVVHFRRAIGNLVQNAVRYCSDVVKVSVEVDEKHTFIYVHVDDDGPGIPNEDRDRIFEPFARLDQSRTRESGGYGLGLAIVKQIANLHDGSIQVSTSPLGGSRFSFELPAYY